MEVTFMCLMRLSSYRLELGRREGEEVGMDVSCLTKVHHGMEQVNWGEVAAWHE